jgi:hypothetical protein
MTWTVWAPQRIMFGCQLALRTADATGLGLGIREDMARCRLRPAPECG